MPSFMRAVAGRYAPTLEQEVLADFIVDGHFARHVKAMRALYQERQDVLLEASQTALGGVLAVSRSVAGMHLVGWLEPGTDDQAAAERAAREGVEVRAVRACALRAQPCPGLMLDYTALGEHEIRAGVRRLAQALSHRGHSGA